VQDNGPSTNASGKAVIAGIAGLSWLPVKWVGSMRIAAYPIVALLLSVAPAVAQECTGGDCNQRPPGAITCEGENCAEALGNKPDVCMGDNCYAPQDGAPEICEGDNCPVVPGPEIIHVQ